MDKKPRGTAVIFNFQWKGTSDERMGTDVDRDNLIKLFHQLNFDVKEYNDKDDMTAKVCYHVHHNWHTCR